MGQSWIETLVNPRSLEGLYSSPPPLEGFHLTDLRLDERGPSCFFAGEFCEFPDFPSPSWDPRAYRLRVEFTLSMLEEFEARGHSFGVDVDLSIARAPDGFGVIISGTGENLHFRITGMSFQLTGLEPQIAAVRMNL